MTEDSGDESNSTEYDTVDWDDLTHVIQPIPKYMGVVFDEMKDLYNYSSWRFHGDCTQLRWTSGEYQRQLCLNTPDDREAVDNWFYLGKYWIPYENFGRSLGHHSHVWSVFIEIGVDKADIHAGMQILVQLDAFPGEIYSEKLYNQEHTVASLADWESFKHVVLRRLRELTKQVEDEEEFSISAESTEAMSDASDDGEM